MGRLSITKNMAMQVMQRFLLLMSCLIFMMKKKPMKKIIVAISLTLLLCLSVGKPLNAQYLDLTIDRSSPGFSLVGYENLKWDNGSTINVYFLDEGKKDIQKKVAEYAVEWTKYANLAFEFYDGSKYKAHEMPASAHIRITFYGDGYWSAIGTDSRNRQWYPKESMCLNRLWELSEDQIRRKVIHEFGHALGLDHEHQSPAAGIKWDKDAVYKDFCVKGYVDTNKKCSNPWSKQMVDDNILVPLQNGKYINYTEFDPDSIMIYEIPADWTTDGFSVAGNTTLSDTDKKGIASQDWYPDKIQDFIPEDIYIANLFSLTCIITEDWGGADECKLVISVDGNKYILRRDMNNGDVWQLNLKYTFKKNISIELYDEDEPDADDYLGGFEKTGTFVGFLNFLEDDAHYSLYLSIEKFVPIVPEPEVVVRAYDGANPTTDSSVRQIQSYVNTIWVEGLISLDAETYLPGPGNILDFEGKSIILNTTPGATVNVVPEDGNTIIIKNSGSGTARIEPGANGKIIIGQ